MGQQRRERVEEVKKIQWTDRLVKPVVKRIPPRIKPNHLSFIRAPITLLVAVFLAVGWNSLAVVFLVAAVVSDILDGPLARHREEQSGTGEWLDACADKVMVVGILLIYGWRCFPTGLIIATVAIELALVLGRPVKIRLGKTAKSNRWGKMKMWFQSAAVIGLAAGAGWTLYLANYFLWAALAFAALSIVWHIRDVVA